jgi:hypothetical protein
MITVGALDIINGWSIFHIMRYPDEGIEFSEDSIDKPQSAI